VPDRTRMRTRNPSACGWIVADRRDLIVPTNSDVRSRGCDASVTASTGIGGMPAGAPCPSGAPPQAAAKTAATTASRESTVRPAPRSDEEIEQMEEVDI